ncbi:uncharacterized protein HD556DRAFT_1481240 [Suillus plorans]|uniref:Uncharacterized protein n=1 Tax=Suillus plorans TaxID=116603 RepID=A0A9P7AMR6_9AGAM|nr:uncharacterized protein HD556DRAFT_1481240 [Suillus plorans]KAG1792656.1 hypothetical protein HD556DRAFT_1481240 [Suillus plorans]
MNSTATALSTALSTALPSPDTSGWCSILSAPASYHFQPFLFYHPSLKPLEDYQDRKAERTGSSTFTFPSMERKCSGPVSVGTPTKTIYDELPTPTASIANVARLPALMGSGLPTGAMLPHMRTKSSSPKDSGKLFVVIRARKPQSSQPDTHPHIHKVGYSMDETGAGPSSQAKSLKP